MKKKIIFVINTLGRAGAETALIELLKNFSKEEYEISLYVLLEQGELIDQIPPSVKILNKDYSKESVLTPEGKKCLTKKIWKRLFIRGAVFKDAPYLIKNTILMLKKKRIFVDKLLWKIMADSGQIIEEHYDIAVAYLEGGSTYYVANYINADKKYTFLHVDYESAGYSRILDQECYLKFDRIFTVSDEVKSSFLKNYPECVKRTYVFHNMINQEEIRRKAEYPGGFEDHYTGKRILTVGRLTAQKGYELAIDAMKILKDREIKARWYVLGDGELREKLQRKIDKLGLKEDFILRGSRDNPYPFYKQCDLYVHATKFEGKSIAVQEAQTLGCAVIVSDCNGNREQVTSGVDGFICQLNPESLSSSIELLLKDEKKRRELEKAAAKKKISENVDIKRIFEI